MMVALPIVLVLMGMSVMVRPAREGIGEIPPSFRPLAHFSIVQQACIQSGSQCLRIDVQRHDAEGLATIAKRLSPLFTSMLRHFALAAFDITRRPPGSGRRAVKIASCQVQTSDLTHARGQPEKAFRSEHGLRILFQEVPKPLWVKWTPRGITERGNPTARRDVL